MAWEASAPYGSHRPGTEIPASSPLCLMPGGSWPALGSPGSRFDEKDTLQNVWK